MSGVFKNSPGEATMEKLQDANAQIEQLCADMGVTFVNIYPLLADETGNIKLDYVLPDGLHIKPATYGIVTETLTPVIKNALLLKQFIS